MKRTTKKRAARKKTTPLSGPTWAEYRRLEERIGECERAVNDCEDAMLAAYPERRVVAAWTHTDTTNGNS